MRFDEARINGFDASDAATTTNDPRDSYDEFVSWLLANDAGVEGIGFMDHFDVTALTPPEELLSVFDRFGEHGVPLQITEFDVQMDGRDDEAKDLLKAYDDAEDVTTGPGSNGPGEVQEAVNALDQRDVEGIRDVMRHVQGNEKGYKEIAGETDVANKLLEGDNGIETGDIEMQRQIRGVGDAPNTKSDVDVDSELTVNGRTLESPAIESKHLSVGDKSDFIIRQESRKLKNKLMTQAADGEDELVVVTTDEYLDRMREQDMLGEIRNGVHQQRSDATVEFTTYGDLEG